MVKCEKDIAQGMQKLWFRSAQKAWRCLQKYLPLGWAEWGLIKGLSYLNQPYMKNKVTWQEAIGEDGVTMVGYFNEPTGLGESVRQMYTALAEVPIAHDTIDITSGGQSYLTPFFTELKYKCNLWHLNGHIAVAMMHKFGAHKVGRHFNVGCWFWETEEFPFYWRPALLYFKELWAVSSFNLSCFKKAVGGSPHVHLIPQPVEIKPEEGDWRYYFSLPKNKLICLIVFAFDSNIERKNPFAAIKAACLANDKLGRNKIHIVVKTTSHSGKYTKEFSRLIEALIGCEYTILDRTLNRQEMVRLYLASDIILSLHRSEGFGLVLAEGMALGKAVVATNWSGPVDFISKNNAWPVSYQLVHNSQRSGYYARGIRWANANIDDAARSIIDIAQNHDATYKKTREAQQTIRSLYSREVVAKCIQKRIEYWMQT